MNIEDIKKILVQGEGITVEFKQSKTELNKDVYESVCAMLNRLGGHLLLGVKDDGTVVGVDKSCVEKLKKNFITSINNPDKICPTVYANMEEFEIDGKTILYTFIPSTPDVHRVSGRIFDRNEDGDIDITNNTNLVAQLYTRKIRMYTELRIFPKVSIDELDKETLIKVRTMANNRHLEEHPWVHMSDIDLLKSANLYRKDPVTQEEGITLAGILLLGTQPLIFSVLPHYKTDAIVRRENTDRYDDRLIALDNLVISYYKLLDFVCKNLKNKFYIGEDTQRIDLRYKIFREVVANTLIHREFSNPYPAKIVIEKDVVYTENANKANGYGTIDNSNFSPFPKNPSIAKFFRIIGLADELGSGIRNATHYLKIYSGGTPRFIEEDVFKQILPIEVISEATPQDALQDTHHDALQDEKRKRMIEYCSEPRTRAELMAFLNLKDRVNFNKKYLVPLLNEGLIEMTIPDKPTSKLQKYVAKK